MRTIIEVPADQLDGLDTVCRRDDISRAEAIRRAVALYLEKERAGGTDDVFGLWRGRSIDSLAHEQTLRDEWASRSRRR
jgi:hypothetical protein